jgi:hypothetical protein
MRMIVIKEKTAGTAVAERVLSGELSASKREAALAQLKQLNPHADFDSLEDDTVLFVPDDPAFKSSETESVFDGVFAGFEKLMKNALEAVADKAKAGAEARVAESEELTRTLKSDSFRTLIENDRELQKEADTAVLLLKKQKEETTRAQEILGAATKSAFASIRKLTPK